MLSAHKRTVAVTIAINESLSGAVAVGDGVFTGIVMPAAWTAAVLTFQASFDGTTFYNLYDEAGGEYTIAADASRYITVPAGDFAGVRFLKVRSGTAAAAVNQAAARTLSLIVRNIQ